MADMVGYSLNQNPNEAAEDDRITAAGVNLPLELIYDILCRLPAKSVGRFRCVSKDWKSLLSSLQFIKNQFIFNNHQTKIIILQDYSFHSFDFRNDCTNNEGHPVAICEALNFKPTNLTYYDIRGSCNGLILLHDFRNLKLSIANPITHEVRQLPSIPQSTVGRLRTFGFGYCLKDDEYIVIIVSNRTRSSPVYMLKENLWKRVEDSPMALEDCGTFVDGSIHWLGYRDFYSSSVLCAFDLASERFREVENPEGSNVRGFLVDVLGGCLCLVRHKDISTDIWVMKEYGLRDSWTKYVAYTPPKLLLFRPLFFWNCDESIVAASERVLVFCGLKQKTSAIIPVIGEQSPSFYYGGRWNFVDSLFSPNSSNAHEGPNQVQV